jgi:hypothetical protein
MNHDYLDSRDASTRADITRLYEKRIHQLQREALCWKLATGAVFIATLFYLLFHH